VIVKVYVETSVISGPLSGDPLVASASRAFFSRVERREMSAHISRYVTREIVTTPEEEKRRKLFTFLRLCKRDAPHGKKVEALADQYVKERAFSSSYRLDAVHIASASIGRYDALATWNKQHIRRLRTKLVVEKVNLRLGLRTPAIVTPEEIL